MPAKRVAKDSWETDFPANGRPCYVKAVGGFIRCTVCNYKFGPDSEWGTDKQMLRIEKHFREEHRRKS